MPNPDPHEVHAWYRSTAGCDTDAVATAWTVLSPDERARADRFHFAEDHRDYVLAHDLLRRTLSRYAPVPPAGWIFERSPEGKPVVGPGLPALHFSLTHTLGFVACAIAHDTPVGIDAERIDRPRSWSRVAGRILAPTEAEALERLEEGDRAARMFDLWTLKEAFVKATGQGLSQAVRDVAFAFPDAQGLTVSPPAGDTGRPWHVALFSPAPDVRLALAVPSAGPAGCRLDVRSDLVPDRTLAPIATTAMVATGHHPQPHRRR